MGIAKQVHVDALVEIQQRVVVDGLLTPSQWFSSFVKPVTDAPLEETEESDEQSESPYGDESEEKVDHSVQRWILAIDAAKERVAQLVVTTANKIKYAGIGNALAKCALDLDTCFDDAVEMSERAPAMAKLDVDKNQPEHVKRFVTSTVCTLAMATLREAMNV